MVKAARGGPSASPSSFASLERFLERTIESLMNGEPTKEAKALLIEARRLRSVVANWRSIPPAPNVQDEMLDRVLHLSTEASAVVAEAAAANVKTELDPVMPAPPTQAQARDIHDEETEAYKLDFEPRHYSLEEESAPAPPSLVVVPPPHVAVDALREAGPHPPPPVYPSAPYPPPPAAYSAPTAGRRAASALAEQPPAEPPVDDAPLAPQTEMTVHPVKLPEKLDPHVVMLSDAYSDRADAYRTLRRKLAASNPRVVAITSSGPGEGKTTCAVNLALALREGARGKVLLLEANVRSPSLSKLLGFEPPECFVDQVERHRDDLRLPWVVVELLPQLHVLAVDPKVRHAPLLDALSFAGAMDSLKLARYDYIVIDTPPVVGSFEVNMIADTVDGVLFSAITMKSKKRAIKKAIEQVMPAPVLGVIVLDA